MTTEPHAEMVALDVDEWGRRPRVLTERTQGVWTTCDDCGEDWWCVVTERDYMDEATAFGCSGGCADGWHPDDLLDDEEADRG